MEQCNIYVAGSFQEQDSWDDLLSRLAWYFTPYLDRISSIALCATPEQVERAAPAATMDPLIAGLLPALKAKIRLTGADRMRQRLQDVDPARHLFLLADDSLADSLAPLIARFRSTGHFYRVDPKRVRMEGSFYLWAGLNVFGDAAGEAAAFKGRFAELAADLGRFDKAYVFGTGPSLSDFVAGHDFSGALTIMANSMVLNPDLLEALKPRLIVAGDPIFHAGCSRYAAAFRRELAHAMEQSGAWFLCPLRDMAIYRAYLPEGLRARVIGVPFDGKAPQSLDLRQDFRLKPYPNILTLMLLPLAATFAREVHIAGCDGRSLTENSGFWQHDKKAQFNDEMDNIKATHPGFFAIDYNDYYFDHARDLEGVLLQLEEAGHPVVMETRSYLPALNMREREGLRPAETDPDREFHPACLAILDPDARGEWGHFLAYDRRLGLAAETEGLAFDVIGRRELAPEARPQTARALHRVFSRHSWTLGNKWPKTDSADLTAFVFELEEALQEIEAGTPEGDILLFMYCGSVEVVDVLEHMLIAHPRVRAMINLFWSYNFDITNAAYQGQWLPLLKRVTERPGRVRITHSTPQIAEQFRRVCGLSIPVLPHPSTTFGDRRARDLAQQPVRGLPDTRAPRILFPGGARLEKGYLLAVEACTLLDAETDYTLCLRARLDGAPPPILEAMPRLERTSVVRDHEDYGETAFVDWLASADVIVIPYLPEAFSDRTSGMLVDAMLLGIPVVVVKGTWLADELAKSGAGLAVEADGAALASAVRAVVADYPAMSAATRLASRQYLEGSLWSSLLDAIVRASGSQLPARPLPGFQFSLCEGKSDAFAVADDLDAAPADLAEGRTCLVVHDDPAEVLAAAVAAGEDWRAARERWMAGARTALGLFYRNRDRVRLAKRDALLQAFADQTETLPAHWQRETASSSALLVQAMRLMLQQDAAAAALLAELGSAAQGANSTGQVAAAAGVDAAVADYQAFGRARQRLADQLDAQKAQTAETEAQARLLEEQLRQLQAVNEQYYSQAIAGQDRIAALEGELAHLRGALDGTKGELDGSKGELDGVRSELDETRQALTQVRGELEHIYHSKSWKVTEPLRSARRALGTGRETRGGI